MGLISDMLEKDPSSVIEGYKKPEVEPERVVEPEKVTNPEKNDEPEKVIEPEKKETVVPIDKLKIASEFFGEDFDSEEKITETIRSLKEKQSEADKLRKELDELKSGIDPAGFFVNEAEYRRQLLLKQFPQYDPELVTRVVLKDVDKMDDLEAIRLYRRLSRPNVYRTDANVDLMLKKELGLESDSAIDLSVADETTQLMVKDLGETARTEFNKIKNSVKLPDKVNLEERKAKELSDKKASFDRNKPLWERALKDVPGDFDKMEFKYTDPGTNQEITLYDHEIEADFKKEVEKAMEKVSELLAQNHEWSIKTEKEEIGKIKLALKTKYLSENVNKIMYAFKKKTEKELSDKLHEEIHNPQKPNLNEKPIAEKSDTQKSKEKVENDILKSHGRV
jgi:hypothetical protein